MIDNISAVLGPTNTGKTFHAVERMLANKTGVIGFPLRLLARENYETVGKRIGKKNVALITGEEKIIPKEAKYFFCTVESMPKEKFFDFLAIDEVQLAANQERGYLFTEKILNSRGRLETLFLGSNSIEKILKGIFPKIKIYKKARLSKLKYYGYKNLVRLPPRSAIIAFSQIEVYSIAEKLKKFKGGVSVVTGALSPEARNSQVKIFENGEVDYIVATDAIGLGLNLAIKYVFFTSLVKFDGLRKRYLTYDEVAQIAGRAGRHLNSGFFGTTQKLKLLEEDLIQFIEEHQYNEIDRIYWRNSKLKFDSIDNLVKSLTKRHINRHFILKKDASDFYYLNIFNNDKKLKEKLRSSKNNELLWDICRIPDYTKTLEDFHLRLLYKIINFLIDDGKIPEKWVDNQVKKIESVSDNISAINTKITQIRTWSYISNKKNWMENSLLYQKKIKKIEDLLSNKLHNSLINKFVDESIKKSKSFFSEYNNKFVEINIRNELVLNNKKIGYLKGFYFKFFDDGYFRQKKLFSYKVLRKSIEEISQKTVNKFIKSEFSNFYFDIEGKIFWDGCLVGRFFKGQDLISPSIEILTDENFSKENIQLIKSKMMRYINFLIKKNLYPFLILKHYFKSREISSSLRAICFRLFENFGFCFKNDILSYYKKLNKKELKLLKEIGFTNGCRFFYIKPISQKSVILSQMLSNLFYSLELRCKFLKKLIQVECKTKKDSHFLKKAYIKLGYTFIEISNQYYYVHYFLTEKLIKGMYFFKKKKISFNKKMLDDCENDLFFLRNCFSNPKLLDFHKN